MYVGKNSSRPASVEFSRQWRENYARSRVQFLQTRAQRSGLRLSVCQIFFDTRSKATAAERWGGFVFFALDRAKCDGEADHAWGGADGGGVAPVGLGPQLPPDHGFSSSR